MITSFKDIYWGMTIAREEANKAFVLDEVPVGAVIMSKDGDIISKAHNLKEKTHDPLGHAELLAIREATKLMGNWRLEDCSLIVSLEPCPMCMGAIIQSRLKNLYFGAYDFKGGAVSLGINIAQNEQLNHSVNIVGGLQHFSCSKLMSDFFKLKRKGYKRN